MLAFFECANTGAYLRFRLHFVLVKQKWPRAIGILQTRVVSAAAGIGHRLDCRYAHHQKLILAGPFELNRRNACALDAGTDNDDAVPAKKRCVMRPKIGNHALREREVVDATTYRKDRHAVGEDPRFAIERYESAVEQTDENRIARVAVNHAVHIGARLVNGGMNRRLRWDRPF